MHATPQQHLISDLDSHALLLQTLEQSIDSVVVIDDRNHVVLFNAAAERLWGYGRDEILGRNVKILVPHEIRTVHDDYIDTNRRTGVNRIVGTSREVPVERKDGSRLWASMSISKVDVQGRTLYTAFLKDVSAERQAREQLRQTLFQAADAVVQLDTQRRVVFFNPAAERLWQIPSKDVLGTDAAQLLGDGLALDGEHGLPRAGANREIAILRSGGERLWGLLSLSRIQVGSHTHYTAFVKDITRERRQREHLADLSLVVDHSDNAVLLLDANRHIAYANAGFSRMLGYTLAQALGKRPTELLAGPHTDSGLLEHIRQRSALPGGWSCEALAYSSTGKPVWISAVVNPIFATDGTLAHIVAVLTDITHTKMHEMLQYKVLHAMVGEQPLEASMTLLCQEVERIAPEIVVSIMAMGEDGRLRCIAAPGLEARLGPVLDHIEIAPMQGSCGTAAAIGAPVLSLDIGRDPRWEGHNAALLAAGLRGCWSNPVMGQGQQVIGTLAFHYHLPTEPNAFHQRLADVCLRLCALMLEREKAKAHIHRLAYYDTLTTLPNRARLYAVGREALAEAQRAGTPLTVVCAGLDRFKQVNDTWGHATGDALLREVGHRVRQSVGPSGIVCKLGGDEFAAVLTGQGAGQSVAIVNDMLSRLTQPFRLDSLILYSQASVGVALYPDDGSDIETLLLHADMAMHRAKTANRGSFSFYTPDLHRFTQEQTMLEADLRLALRTDGLALHFQPKVLSRTPDVLHGVEALLRWEHPVLGPVAPPRFIALAEECGFIDDLSRWVLRSACRQMADWRARRLPVPHISINLSASNFHDPELPELIASTLLDHGLRPSDLTVEMTENVMLNTDPVVIGTLQALRRLGVSLSMDDFGTGYSSLSHLHRLPISELKLDKEFIQDLEHSEPARALIASVLHIGRSLGMQVVAEGVETPRQMEFLVEHGCPVMQGYLFARPAPPELFERWLQRG